LSDSALDSRDGVEVKKEEDEEEEVEEDVEEAEEEAILKRSDFRC
jgi:hypothetical protein